MKEKIYIVGAGISGLIAAINLEKAGYSPVIYEATATAGGRIKTDVVEGYQLDHGFQVLLDAYPKAREYFDYDALNLQRILPGTTLFEPGNEITLGDPSRHLPFLWPTLISGVATFRDVYLLWLMHRRLQKLSDEDIFQMEEMSTLEYLRKQGFSERLINTFFKPFFTGIFLETDLQTSCRMFQFVFKMFGKGYATLPESGMGALADHLTKRLQRTKIHYNSPVAGVEEGKLVLKDGQELQADCILVATAATDLLPKKKEVVTWKSCDTLYFLTRVRSIRKPMIGLITQSDSLINNIFYPTSISCENRGPEELLSVTVVKEHHLNEKELVRQVSKELHALCGIEDVSFLRRYQISKALPKLPSLTAQWTEENGKLGKSIFIAGDHLLYGSTNAAILSGEMSAQAIISYVSTEQ
ncbi:MAG: NAD(P)-binding protein [Flavobacteriaceae bacterium]|nr:NAD(P)-binding protein [Flavobacteriaceae bacterium]